VFYFVALVGRDWNQLLVSIKDLYELIQEVKGVETVGV